MKNLRFTFVVIACMMLSGFAYGQKGGIIIGNNVEGYITTVCVSSDIPATATITVTWWWDDGTTSVQSGISLPTESCISFSGSQFRLGDVNGIMVPVLCGIPKMNISVTCFNQTQRRQYFGHVSSASFYFDSNYVEPPFPPIIFPPAIPID